MVGLCVEEIIIVSFTSRKQTTEQSLHSASSSEADLIQITATCGRSDMKEIGGGGGGWHISIYTALWSPDKSCDA